MDYVSMYITNDLIFYRIIFKMREIYYIENKDFKSYQSCKQFIKCYALQYFALYFILFWLNLYNIYYVYIIQDDNHWKYHGKFLIAFNSMIGTVHCFMTFRFYQTFMNFFKEFKKTGQIKTN